MYGEMFHRSPTVKFTSRLAALACAALLIPTLAGAGPELRIPDFSHLRDKASDSVDITLDGFLMRIARNIAAREAERGDADLAFLKDVKSVRVQTFEFDHDDAYSRDDIEAVRRQLAAPGWSALLQAKSRKEKSNVDVFIHSADGRILGIALVAAEPRSFAIVNVVGDIDIEELAKLEGRFGIPPVGRGE